MSGGDLDGGVEDAAEADGVLEEAVDVEHGGVGAGVGDVVDVRDHLLTHGRCAAGDPSLLAGADDGPGPPVWECTFVGVFLFYVFLLLL